MEAILNYLKSNETRKKIILFLRKNDLKKTNHAFEEKIEKIPIKNLFFDNEVDSFELFQYLSLKLLKHPDDKQIMSFILSNKAKFDPVADRFIKY